jgi:hypothetical protein
MRKGKYGVHSVLHFLSISVSVFSACFCVLLMAGEYYTAQNKLEIYNNEFQGWEACRRTEPGYYKASAGVVSTCVNNLEEAKNNFWVKHPKNAIIILFILAGLGSAVSGYLVVWAVWFSGLGISIFIKWVTLCIEKKGFCICTGQKDKNTSREFENPEYQMYRPVEDQNRTREEELIHQVEMLRDEVFSVVTDFDNPPEIKDKSPKDEFNS